MFGSSSKQIVFTYQDKQMHICKMCLTLYVPSATCFDRCRDKDIVTFVHLLVMLCLLYELKYPF
jgi:RNase P subunit RPR2